MAGEAVRWIVFAGKPVQRGEVGSGVLAHLFGPQLEVRQPVLVLVAGHRVRHAGAFARQPGLHLGPLPALVAVPGQQAAQ